VNDKAQTARPGGCRRQDSLRSNRDRNIAPSSGDQRHYGRQRTQQHNSKQKGGSQNGALFVGAADPWLISYPVGKRH
jgi:hypothetical protein